MADDPNANQSATAVLDAPANTRAPDQGGDQDSAGLEETAAAQDVDESSAEPAPAEPAAPDFRDLFLKLQAAPERDVDQWLAENPQHPLAKRVNALASRGLEKALKGEKERLEAEATTRAQQAARDAAEAREREYDQLVELANQGDYDAKEKLGDHAISQGLRAREAKQRQAILNDPVVLTERTQDAALQIIHQLVNHPDLAQHGNDLFEVAGQGAVTAGDFLVNVQKEIVRRALSDTIPKSEHKRLLEAAVVAERTRLHGTAPNPDLAPSADRSLAGSSLERISALTEKYARNGGLSDSEMAELRQLDAA